MSDLDVSKNYSITSYMIREDLTLAKATFYRENTIGSRVVTELQDNPCSLSYVGYFCGQAIEKSLKYYIERYNPTSWDKVRYTHDIDTLLDTVEECRRGFRNEHEDIAVNSRAITYTKNMRYLVSTLDKEGAYYLFNIARSLYKEVEKDMLNELKDRKGFSQWEQEHYDKVELTRFKRVRNKKTEHGDD